MDYTLDDLKGKYVKAGTPDAEIFLDACDNLGVLWLSGSKPKNYTLTIGSKIFVNSEDKLSGECCDEFKKATPFTPKPLWSIYTNDKPLSELSDEQYGKMRRAHDNGATVQSLNEDGYGFQDVGLPTWITNGVYRIKQKSECELFVDVAVSVYDGRTGLSESAMILAAQMLFNAGCRFTEDNNK